MREKTKVQAKATEQGRAPAHTSASASTRSAANSILGFQQTLGNQAMLQLLEAGVIQAKLRLSQPGDADEQEADRTAEKVVSATHAPKIQRKCACAGGTPCAKCASQDDETIHRSIATPLSRASEPSIQRAPAEKSATPEETPTKTAPHHQAAHPVVVEDDAEKVEPHQMRKSQFLALLRTDACATADAVLTSVGKSTKGCPYIEKWLGFYEKQSSQHIEAAIRKYAPETARARSAHEAIRLLLVRVQRAALSWAKTGKVEGLPHEMADAVTGQKSLLEKVHDFASTGVAGAIFGFIGGKGKSQDSGSGSVMRKAHTAEPTPAHDAGSVKSQLGSGHSLDSRVQSQMSSAFGYDFSGVRMHTDSSAAKLSSELQAHAFTIGNDVAFASGEYKPGTLVGDALIAHELAHVVQQSGANSASIPQRKSEGDDQALEAGADTSALFATAIAWGYVNESAKTDVRSNWRSPLRLQRCGNEPDKVVLKNLSPAQRKKFEKDFVDRNFSPKDRETAQKILDDMLQSGEVSFKDEDALRTEIFKRLETSKFMQESQALYGKAFEYPNHPKAKACLPNNKDGKLNNPRVNKAAEAYWGPVQDAQGDYHWDLSEVGKQNAYKALTTLFIPQKSICDMTLIHCDYLASVVHFRAFAESIGVEEFNKRVKNGDIEMRLAWNGFQDIEDVGWSHSKKSVSLREVRPVNEGDLVIGDHVIFWNHRAYDALNAGVGNAWRLENAILVYRRGKEDHFLGHGSGDNTNETMRRKLAQEYNVVIKKAKDIITRTRSKDMSVASKATSDMNKQFPNVKIEAGDWVITAKGKTFKVEPINWNDPDLTGLRSPDDRSKMNCVKRPAEAPGESC